MTGAITVSPVHKRVGFYFSMSPQNLTEDDLFVFVQQLRGHLKRPLLIIWDRFSGHKKAARLLRDLYSTRIHVEELPAYAPELNVVDHAWGHTKYGELANFIPRDLDDLADEVAVPCSANINGRTCCEPFSSMLGATYERGVYDFKGQ